MTSDPLVSIIIISYNTRQMTLECIQTVIDETTVPYELIVLDNASPDGSAEAVAEAYPDIMLMAETENLGYAKGNNVAVTHARGEYILLLNPDTLILDGAIDKMMDFAKRRPDAGIWGCKHLTADRKLNESCCWRRLTLWNVFCRTTGLTGIFPNSELFNSENYGGWDRNNERQIDVVIGAFMLMKRDFWDQLGGFDLRYIMYGEETDLCLRAAAAGAAPLLYPDAEIVHYQSASQTVRVDKQIRMLKGKLTLIDTHFPPWQRLIGRTLFGLWPLTRAMASRLRGGKGEGAVWAEIWSRRSEWWDGYPPLEG